MIYVPHIRVWGKSYRRLLNNLGRYHTTPERAKIVLSFGHYYDPKALCLNHNNEVMTNKILMNKLLDKLRIPHPKTYYYPFTNLPDSNEECVIKKQYSFKGKDIRFSSFDRVKEDYNLQHNDYIQHFVPFEREFRVAIDWYRIFGIREKMGNAKIRNSLTCYYETRDIPKLRDFALDVYRKMKVDFTGIDIGLYNGYYIVIELNSSPTVGDYWAKLLSEDLILLLDDKKKQKELKNKKCLTLIED